MISKIEEIYDLLEKGEPIDKKYLFVHPVKTKNKSIQLSLGRIWFNLLLPDKIDLIDRPIRKPDMDKLIVEIIEKYPPDEASDICSRICEEAFKLASIKPASFTIDALIIPKELEEKKKAFLDKAKTLTPSEFIKESDELVKEFIDYMEKNNVAIHKILKGGVKGNPLSDWKTLLISKGYVFDIEGNLLGPLKSLEDGYTKEDYYHAAAEARDLFFKKAIATEKPGYLARKITMANVNLVIDDSKDDCGTKKYLTIQVTDEISKRIINRYFIGKDSKLEKISSPDQVKNKTIQLRSPIYCKAKKGICPTCYGDHWKKVDTKQIGILAGGAFNAVGINTLMKLKHAGTQINIIEVDFIKLLNIPSFEGKEEYFDIRKHEIFARKDAVISINEKDYSETDLIDAGEYLFLPGIIDVHFENRTFTLPLQFHIKLYKPENYRNEGGVLYLEYSPGERIIYTENYEKKVDPAIIDRILEGLSKYITTPEIMLDVLVDLVSGIDMVHLEVIVSNMFRDKDDPSVPCRLASYKNAKIYGQKDLPYLTSWLTGLLFERINKAIKFGLMSEEEIDFNVLEKIALEKYRE